MSLQFQVIPAVLFALVASPATYQATRGVLGGWVATPEGTARIGGLILHAIVFVLLATLAMRYFPSKRSTFNHSGQVNSQVGMMGTKLTEVPHMMAPAPY